MARPADEQTPLLHATSTDPVPDLVSEAGTGDGSHRVSRARGLLICLCVFVVCFFQAANMSGLTTTQSSIATELDAFDSVSWFASSYLIGSAALAPVAGRLSQIFSPRACLGVACLIFSSGVLVTSQAQSVEVFLGGRVITGIGSSGLMTLAIILVLELCEEKRRGLFVGLLNANFTVGVAAGAVIAGALLPATGWRALFWGQTPITAIAGLGLYFVVPKSLDSVASDEKLWAKLARIDYLGALSLTAGVTLFLLGLSSTKVIWEYLVIAAGILVLFLANEFYLAGDPIMPVAVLTSRGALLSCLAQLGLMSARWTVLFYSPTYAIATLGWSSGMAGMLLVATNIGFGSGGLLAGHFHIRRAESYYLPCIVTFVLFSISLYGLGLVSRPDLTPAFYMVITCINGATTGAALNYTLAHALHLTPKPTHFVVTSLLATIRSLAGSFGSAIGGGIFVRNLRALLEAGFADAGLPHREALIRELLGSPATVQTLVGAERAVAVQAYALSLHNLYVAAAGFSVLVIVVQALTGWEEPKKAEVETSEE